LTVQICSFWTNSPNAWFDAMAAKGHSRPAFDPDQACCKHNLPRVVFMKSVGSAIAVAPVWIGVLARAVPISLLDFTVVKLINRMVATHPELNDRLGKHTDAVFLLDPTDLPILLRVQPSASAPVRSLRHPCPCDVHIRAPLAAFLSMLHGAQDGDALFFSRELAIAGDTEAVLALRNAIDAAEIDLTADFAQLFGPFRSQVERSARSFLPVFERLTGLSLTGRGNQEG
jgi:predicted lipid carrier protein YhbT